TLALGDQVDRLFGQPFRDRVGLDLGDETGRILTIEEAVDLGGRGTHAMDSSRDCAGCATGTRVARLRPRAAAVFTAGFTGSASDSSSGTTRIMSASVTLSSVRRTMRLMRCQFERMRQLRSNPQMPDAALHSVRPKGCSSSASTISATLIDSGARLSE